MKIHIHTSLFGTSGYAVHGFNLSRELNKLADVSLESPLPQGWEKQVPQDVYEMLTKKPHLKHNVLSIETPPVWPLRTADRPQNFIGFAVFEGTQAPQQWATECNKSIVKLVFVPSTHTAQSLIKAGTETIKIRVVPHGHNPTEFYPQPIPHDKFRFGFNKGWNQGTNDRSALHVLIKSFKTEFKDEEPVELHCNINPAYSQPNRNLQQELQQLGINNFANINIVTGLNQKQLLDFYNSSDVFVMPSKTEAFGIPALEAMACQVPVITTGFGGQTDYVNQENGWLINYKLFEPKNIHLGYDWAMYEECQWAEPSQTHLQQLMRYCYEHREEVKTKGIKAAETAQTLTWKHSAQKALQYLNELQ